MRFRLRNWIGLSRYVVQACCIQQLGLVLFVLVVVSLFSAIRVDANFVPFLFPVRNLVHPALLPGIPACVPVVVFARGLRWPGGILRLHLHHHLRIPQPQVALTEGEYMMSSL